MFKVTRYKELAIVILSFSAPDENPTNVVGAGMEPGNLVISWTVRRVWFVELDLNYFTIIFFSRRHFDIPFCVAPHRIPVKWSWT